MILAVDPGLMVGYAIQYDDGLIKSDQDQKWDFLTWCDPEGWTKWFDVVVAERYIITPRTARLSQQHDALDILGNLRWWCRKMETPLIEYSAAEAKSFSTDDKLRAADMWISGKDHARDASRHLMLYLVREGIMDPAMLR